MNSKTTDKYIFLASIITVVFLLLVYLNYAIFKLDFVLIGVLRELLTIPCILAQPILLFLSLRKFIEIKFKVKSYAFCTSIITLIATILTLGSLITSF